MASKTLINAIIGDLLKQNDCDAIVNSAHPSMLAGSGVCGQIHKAAGKELEQYGKQYAPLQVTQAVITPAFNLANRHIIHVSAPRFHQEMEPFQALDAALDNALRLAEKYDIKKIAIPAIGTGVYGFPINDAISTFTNVAFRFSESEILKEIRFVLTSEDALTSFKHFYKSVTH